MESASAHRGRRALRANGDGARSRGATPRDVGVFSGSRGADVAGSAFKRNVLAEAARRAAGDERAYGVGCARKYFAVADDAGSDSFGGTNDVHAGERGARRRYRGDGALREAGGTFSKYEGAGAAVECAAE